MHACNPHTPDEEEEGGKFGSSLGDIARPYLKIQKNSNKRGA